MAEIIANLTLDTFRKNNIPPLVVPQGDYGAREIRISITNQGKPVSVKKSDAVSIIANRSGDGESKAYSGRVNDDGTVNVPIVQWMLDVPGEDVICHVSVTGNGYQYSTNEFLIEPQLKENPAEISIDDPRQDIITEVLANEAERQANEAERQANEAERQEEFKDWFSVYDKRLDNLEAGLPASAWQTDDSVAYQKAVPANANPYAAITKIGGMTYNDNGTLRSSPVTSIKSVGRNVSDISEPKIGYFSDGTGGFASGITSYVGFYVLAVNPNTTYTISCNARMYSMWEDDGVKPTYRKTVDTTVYTFVTSETTKRLRVSVIVSSTAFEWFMINEGSTALPYRPYHDPITTQLPTSVLSLNGYGLGVSSANCNYIDWRPADGVKQYVQTCAERAYQSGDESLSNVVTDGSTKTVYVLDTPVTTDLSTVLSDDNLFEVEGGGSLTFDNEHQNAVPSTVIYQLDTNT